MNNQRPLGPKDEKAELDYDLSFLGVNERLPAMSLPPGYVTSATNCRFRNGKAETRAGVMITPWLLGEDGRTPFTEVYGAIVFGDPSTSFWFLIAADGGVWKTAPGRVATPVPLPPGVVLTAATFAKFTQNFNEVVMQRGPDFPQLAMTTLDEGFRFIQLTADDIAADLSPIPNSSFGVNFLNRQWLIDGQDTLAVSDVLNYTGYIPVVESFRINQGEADALVALAPFGPAQMLALKSNRVYLVGNAVGDLSSVATTLLTDEYGCGAALSVSVRGTQAYWVDGEGKIASIVLTSLNATQATSERLSDDIPVTINRINHQYLAGCVTEIWDGKLYVAAPLDDAEFAQANLAANGGYEQPVYPVVIGKKYRLVVNADPTFISLTCGNDTFVDDGEFIASANTVTFAGTDGTQLILAELFPLLVGVNTGVIVYDFQLGAWQGVDEAEGVFCVKAFLRFPFNGELRLFMIGADGVLRLYEEGLEDDILQQVAAPYIDVLVTSLPSPGDSITTQGGKGDTILAANSSTNTNETWGCDTLADAQANLFLGYSESGWNPGQVTVTQIDQGIRVTGTTGEVVTPPVVDIGGTWGFVDRHTGIEVTSIPIITDVVTRGYVTRSYIFANEDKKRFLMLAGMINSWASQYQISAIVNGVNQETDYAEFTADNTKYAVFSQPEWQPDNANDDWGLPKRQDYSVVLPDLGFNLLSGVIPGTAQTATHRTPTSEFGHWIQFHLNSTVGRVELQAVFMEAQEGDKLSGRTI